MTLDPHHAWLLVVVLMIWGALMMMQPRLVGLAMFVLGLVLWAAGYQRGWSW